MLKVTRLSKEYVLSLLPHRNPNTHKGDYGKILLLCGSKGYTGAAALSAMGALRSGAGLVYLAVPESIYTVEASKLLEPVVLALQDDENGGYSISAVNQVRQWLPKMDAVLVGPGIGRGEGALAITKMILSEAKIPVVLDADGINVIAAHKDIVRDRRYPTILTPHAGEFMRIAGQTPGTDRMESARRLAQDLGAVVLLKGHRTVITDGEVCYESTTGNPGMATGGSGDVLAGLIVSLLGQGLTPLQSAACGAWLHGTCGDICAEEIGQYGMLPQDMIGVLPRLLP